MEFSKIGERRQMLIDETVNPLLYDSGCFKTQILHWTQNSTKIGYCSKLNFDGFMHLAASNSPCKHYCGQHKSCLSSMLVKCTCN